MAWHSSSYSEHGHFSKKSKKITLLITVDKMCKIWIDEVQFCIQFQEMKMAQHCSNSEHGHFRAALISRCIPSASVSTKHQRIQTTT